MQCLFLLLLMLYYPAKTKHTNQLCSVPFMWITFFSLRNQVTVFLICSAKHNSQPRVMSYEIFRAQARPPWQYFQSPSLYHSPFCWYWCSIFSVLLLIAMQLFISALASWSRSWVSLWRGGFSTLLFYLVHTYEKGLREKDNAVCSNSSHC